MARRVYVTPGASKISRAKGSGREGGGRIIPPVLENRGPFRKDLRRGSPRNLEGTADPNRDIMLGRVESRTQCDTILVYYYACNRV